jgi:hypothetical protein
MPVVSRLIAKRRLIHWMGQFFIPSGESISHPF